MAPQTLNRIYADEMQNHPYGYGLYQPVFSTVIKPGVVGFFDPSGFWSPLADLNDPADLAKLGLKPPRTALSPAPPQDQTWSPMTSKTVSGHNLDTTAGTDPKITGLPVTAQVQIKYTSSSTFGAVLVTSPPITHNAFYYTSPFSQWVTDNAHALLSGPYKDDIHLNGVVVITQTYTTSKCSLTAWTDEKSEVFLGFEANVPGIGGAHPQGGWTEGNSASGWQKYEQKDDDKLVVFVGGLWYDCQKEGFGTVLPIGNDKSAPHPQHITATDPKTGPHPQQITVTDPKGDKYVLNAKIVGNKLAKD